MGGGQMEGLGIQDVEGGQMEGLDIQDVGGGADEGGYIYLYSIHNMLVQYTLYTFTVYIIYVYSIHCVFVQYTLCICTVYTVQLLRMRVWNVLVFKHVLRTLSTANSVLITRIDISVK